MGNTYLRAFISSPAPILCAMPTVKPASIYSIKIVEICARMAGILFSHNDFVFIPVPSAHAYERRFPAGAWPLRRIGTGRQH